jgi:heme/copper-type cytochrome/quinol oxidase subunit 2
MTDQGKVHAVWAIVVIILLAIIGFLVFKPTNDFKDENSEQNPNTLMENEQKPATMETTESTAAEEASAWKLHQNTIPRRVPLCLMNW